MIAYSRVALIKDAVGSPGSGVAGAFKDEPMPGDALTLAMEDYLLRHAPGWVMGGPTIDSPTRPPGLEQQRAELDRRIQDSAEHASAYYGPLRKRR